MAWVTIKDGANADTVWQYENTATASNTYSDANGSYSGGIRTFTPPGGSAQQNYARCRKVGETTERGELSKDFYDALNA
jgi:hypothetical protein